MKNRFLLSILCVLYIFAVSAQPLRDDFETLLGDDVFLQSDVSLVVYDLDADSLLFSHREHKLCRPASVLKVVTALAALERLGCDYAVDTRLLRKGNNLYLQGSVDPLFSYDDLKTLSV